MKEITQGVDNINLAANSYKKNRIQVSNTKEPLFFYIILAKVSYAATLHSLLISDESYRPIIGSKRHILYSLLLIITVANVPSRSIKDALKALFGIALYQLNQASLVGLGVVPALVSLIVRDASTGIVEDATAMLAQIAGCKESEEAMRKAGGFRVLCDLLDEWTGASGRIRENAVAALLNLAWCGGENGRKEVREMGAKVMEGITEVAENGSAKGKNKAVELLKFIVDRNGNGNESEGHRQILTKELEAVGLRLNKRPPQIYFKKKKTGGISFNNTLPLTHVNEKLCYQILHEYKIHNAEVLFREDATVDDLIDVIEGNSKYIKCAYVYNKIDVIGIDDVDKFELRAS